MNALVKRWLAFDIGCIECGEDSDVIGTFDTQAEAEEACDSAMKKHCANWHGQHSFQVFDLTEAKP